MTWAIFRKELREQWLFAAVLVALGAAALAALGQLIGPPSYNRLDARPVAALLMAVAGGIVCGAMLLAGERETGTLPFLDTLPVSRSRLWAAKATFGVVLTLAQAGLLMGLTWGMGYLDGEDRVGWSIGIIGGALLAYVWGLYGSASGRTVLGAVGRGLMAMFVAGAGLLLVKVP
ncbi:MAG TPA: ABC transporter permease, partial [Gemmataceae bacterium]